MISLGARAARSTLCLKHTHDSACKAARKSIKQIVRMTPRAGVVLPSAGHPDPIRALRHPWRACHETSALRLDQ